MSSSGFALISELITWFSTKAYPAQPDRQDSLANLSWRSLDQLWLAPNPPPPLVGPWVRFLYSFLPHQLSRSKGSKSEKYCSYMKNMKKRFYSFNNLLTSQRWIGLQFLIVSDPSAATLAALLLQLLLNVVPLWKWCPHDQNKLWMPCMHLLPLTYLTISSCWGLTFSWLSLWW